MWHVFLSSPLCCAALSPGWESSCVPLWDVFDFTTCGETFHLLIFPGVWGCNRLCKHILIHHQLHNRLQSFLIPLKSLWTTMKMNFFFLFLPGTWQGLLKKTKKTTPHTFQFLLSFFNYTLLIKNSAVTGDLSFLNSHIVCYILVASPQLLQELKGF